MNVTVALATPVAGMVCVPFRYFQVMTFPPASYNPTQSPGVPGAFATVAVTSPPAAPVPALSVTLGRVTVIDALVATSTYAALKRRTWYVPAVGGSWSVRTAVVTPVAGFTCVPLRYCQLKAVAPPVAYNPIQSPGVPGAFAIVAATVPPALPVVAFSVTVGAVMVIDPLVANSM